MKEIKADVRKSRIKAVVNGLQEARAPVASNRSGLRPGYSRSTYGN